jgi:hypothetical protein
MGEARSAAEKKVAVASFGKCIRVLQKRVGRQEVSIDGWITNQLTE